MASAEHLVALKARAARRQDLQDLRLLIAHLGLATPAQVLAIVDAVFPDDPLPDRQPLLVEDLFGAT